MSPNLSLARAIARFILVCAAAFSASSAARAQSARDGFEPNANGPIYAIFVQPDGKILIGGDFTSLAPNGGPAVTRNRIARLNVDGTVDPAFNPNASSTISALAVQQDGKVLVGGGPMTIGGQFRTGFARLDSLTGAADSFDPRPNGGVNSIIVHSNGKVLVGGLFMNFGGQPRKGIARFDAATGVVDSFKPDPDQPVLCLAVQADGKILVGGAIRNVGGQARNFIARLDPTTGLADSFNPNPDGLVRKLAVQPDGKILAAGDFTSIGGQARNRFARLDAASALADSFDPNPNSNVAAIVIQPDGKILVGGNFSGPNSIGGQTRNHIARLDPATGGADSFDPTASGWVSSIAVQSDGKVLVGGGFTGAGSIAGGARNHIARLQADGRLDQTLNLSLAWDGMMAPNVTEFATQPDGKLLIAGNFGGVMGVPRKGMARLNTDGTVDLAFEPTPNGEVNSIAVQEDGKILVAGRFTRIGGQPRNYIARLDATTGLADSFNPDANLPVAALAVLPDGNILVGGVFQGEKSIGGASRNFIARLDPVTGLADGFTPHADGYVSSILLQRDGKLLVVGQFTQIGGASRNRLARLDPVSGAADSFDATANGTVGTIALQPDGRILVGGSFSSIGGQARSKVARLDPVTALADSFNPSPDVGVATLAVQADGKIVLGGFFSTIGGQARERIARLDTNGVPDSFAATPGGPVTSMMLHQGKIVARGQFGPSLVRFTNDTAALQELNVSHQAIRWSMGGSSPCFERVTFEYSENGTNYTSLGAGTADGTTWSFRDVKLPTHQNFFIRARGWVRSNVGESIVESIRAAYLTEPLALVAAASRKTHGNAGTFDIPLSLTGEPGVECRSSGGAHTLVFTFSKAVAAGTASLSSSVGAISGQPSFSGNTMTVDLVNVADAQKLTISLSGVVDDAGETLAATAVSVNMLIGDSNGSKVVNASDIGAIKAQSGVPVTADNFRADVAVSGGITASDIGLVKSRSGQSVP